MLAQPIHVSPPYIAVSDGTKTRFSQISEADKQEANE